MPPSFFKNMCETTLNIQSTYKVGQNTVIKIECYNPTYRGEISPHLPHAIRRGEAFDHRPHRTHRIHQPPMIFFPTWCPLLRWVDVLIFAIFNCPCMISKSRCLEAAWLEQKKRRSAGNLFHGKFQTGKQFFVKFEGSNRGSWNITTTTQKMHLTTLSKVRRPWALPQEWSEGLELMWTPKNRLSRFAASSSLFFEHIPYRHPGKHLLRFGMTGSIGIPPTCFRYTSAYVSAGFWDCFNCLDTVMMCQGFNRHKSSKSQEFSSVTVDDSGNPPNQMGKSLWKTKPL